MHDVGQRAGELEEFLYRVSHDLRAPAVAVLGFAEALRHRLGPTEDDVDLYLDRITANARLIDRQLEALLELSRVGRVHADRDRIALDELARRVAASVVEQWPALTVAIDRLPAVDANPFRLEQLLHAVLDNAARHNARPVLVVVSWEPAGDGGVLVVADDGVGIPEPYRAEVFEVFRRLEPSDAATSTLGVGLALVRRIVEELGGEVTLGDGPDGRGLAVRIALPAKAFDAESIA